MVKITEAAARRISELVEDEGLVDAGLRIFVEKGGCSGLQYSMQIASAEPGDEMVEAHGSRVFLDDEAVRYLRGSVIDFSDTLNNTGFRIQNPNAKQTCGCGTSFEA